MIRYITYSYICIILGAVLFGDPKNWSIFQSAFRRRGHRLRFQVHPKNAGFSGFKGLGFKGLGFREFRV